MLHTTIGNIGHLLVIIAFVAAMVSAFSYFYAANQDKLDIANRMRKFARGAFFVHGSAVVGVVITLFLIIYNHYYEYHYAWSHSSNNLPTHFMISCFWEGQEGSFLLWIFWHVLIGLVLLRTASKWENQVMGVFATVQTFLVSMILGVVIFESIKIGSSPFILLRDASNAPIFQTNPDFIPLDGNGLNPLLQNYWMVIHPPTLFLGFAATLVPFAFCMAGLMTGQYKEWVKPALPWAQIAAGILGIGIMMGAYWAYETLNFGGYWNWDPVENAVYIPWVVLVAAIHVMIVFRKNNSALKASMVLVVMSFILILYATFLTRSGILGEASVHSFTDLGLSGQLLLYLFAFIGISVFFLVKAWKELPSSDKELTIYNREFWIFMGATVLCLSSFQVLLPTSIPVFNAFVELFGVESNIAPPADQVTYYTKIQLWFGLAIALLSGTGQFFWWKKMDAKQLQTALSVPLLLTFILTGVVILLAGITNWKFILLLTAGIYSLVSNSTILLKLAKINVKLSGGAVTHIGVAMMLVGILASAGYSKIISLNNTGLLYNRDFPEEMNKEHLLLFRNQPQKMADYTLTYRGQKMESKQVPGYIDKELLLPIAEPHRSIVREDLVANGKTYAERGDTIQIYGENTYYEIEYLKENGERFTLYPRIQNNPQMGFVPSPDISQFWTRDLYTHITNIPDPDAPAEWSEPESFTLSLGDTFFINDFVAILDNVVRTEEVIEVPLGEGDVAVKANIRVLGLEQTYDVQPVYLIKNRNIGFVPDVVRDLGAKVQFEKIDPESGKFTLSVATTQKDWVILKAIEMPFINILWVGTILMGIGFGIAVYRRWTEYKQLSNKSSITPAPRKKQEAVV